METSLAELGLLVVVVYALYKLLAPLQRACERLILLFLLGDKRVIDVETVETKKKNRKD